MNTFKQHIPTFVDHREEIPVYEFDTLEELLQLEVVRRYSNDKDFSHFALSENHLMQISDNGFKWWVVGSIKNPDELDLPQWDGGKYKAGFPDGEIKILTNEVASSCGGVLTLTDGTEVLNMKY